MKKVIKDKKGEADTKIFMIITAYLILSSTIIGILSSEFLGEETTYELDANVTIDDLPDTIEPTSSWSILKTIFKVNLLFGATSGLNLWFGIFNSILTYTWFFLLVRLIRGS